MKEHTKAVLEACTGQLVASGMTRRRRGLAVWQMNAEMWGGIGMQVQILSSGAVRIMPVPQIVWDPVEQLVAHGKGMGYRAWSPTTVTRSRVLIPPREFGPLEFEYQEVDGSVLERFGGYVKKMLVPLILDMADEREILQFFRDGAGQGGGRAEHVLAIRAWQTKSLDLVEEYGRVLSVQTQEELRARLERFQHRLIASDAAQALLQGQEAAL